MPPIFLIGYMCSGKTTLGAALAQALSTSRNITFIDLDQYIESQAGMSVREIFATQGEAAFRQMEVDALKQMCGRHDVLVACGGGTPCRPGAMETMNAAGRTVFLDVSVQKLSKRLMDGAAQRPLVAHICDEQQMQRFVEDALANRLPYYKKAKYVFDANSLDSQEELDRAVDKFIKEIL